MKRHPRHFGYANVTYYVDMRGLWVDLYDEAVSSSEENAG